MSDPLARLHARRRVSRHLRQRLRMAAAPYAVLSEKETTEEMDHRRARQRQTRIARIRAELDYAVSVSTTAPPYSTTMSSSADDPAANAKAIAYLLRRAMDPKDGTDD